MFRADEFVLYDTPLRFRRATSFWNSGRIILAMLLFLFGDWVMLVIECLNTAPAAFHYVAMPPKPFSFLISYPGLTFALDETLRLTTLFLCVDFCLSRASCKLRHLQCRYYRHVANILHVCE